MTVGVPQQRDGSAPDRAELARALGVAHHDPLLEQALTHRSYAYENDCLSCGRLACLGKAALQVVITDLLFRRYPEAAEGPLSKVRGALLAGPALAGAARSLGVGAHLRLGRGEQAGGGRDKDSILAETLTALIGVVHQRNRMDGVSELVHRLFGDLVGRMALLDPGLDWKSELQALAAREGLGEPRYRSERSGPDHDAHFRVWVRVGKVEYGPSEGSRIKEAEKQVAGVAWHAITG